MEYTEEFKEIAHSGGQLIIRVGKDADGRRGYQLTWQNSRPVAAGIFAIYALPPHGIPVCQAKLGGMGSPLPAAPIAGCFLVFIGSDSEGLYGRQCPDCGGYWRNQLGTICPYCGYRGEVHDLLTTAQRSYVRQVCARMTEALEGEDGEHVINMDT